MRQAAQGEGSLRGARRPGRRASRSSACWRSRPVRPAPSRPVSPTTHPADPDRDLAADHHRSTVRAERLERRSSTPRRPTSRASTTSTCPSSFIAPGPGALRLQLLELPRRARPTARPASRPNLQGLGAGTVDFWVSTGRMPLANTERAGHPQAPEVRPAPDPRDRGVGAVPHPGRGHPGPHRQHHTAPTSQAGSTLFTLNCAACHTITGAGDALVGGCLRAEPPPGHHHPDRRGHPLGSGQHAPLRPGQHHRHRGPRHRRLRARVDPAPLQPGRLRPGRDRSGRRGLRRAAPRRGRPDAGLLLDRGPDVSDDVGDLSKGRCRRPRSTTRTCSPTPSIPSAPRRSPRPRWSSAFLGFVGFGIAYWVSDNTQWQAATLGIGMLGLGFGVTAWGKYLMPQGPFVEERHEFHSTEAERDAMTAAVVERGGIVLKRRKMLGGLFATGVGGHGRRPPLPLLRSLGPKPGTTPSFATNWKKGSQAGHRRRPAGHGRRPRGRAACSPSSRKGFEGSSPDQVILIRLAELAPAASHAAGPHRLGRRRVRRLLEDVHPPRLPGRSLPGADPAAGLPLPPVDLQRAGRGGPRVRPRAPPAPAAAHHRRTSTGTCGRRAASTRPVGPGFWERP